ncbi:Pre-mRNA-splicing factor CWC25 like protein [Habropoda laboriosa]|uniref:Pre-mRNA-splicing factor CWC25 like protein n=2 Tax=Habropoda laboriosa TaxID=597456 RepID=A0A0L7R145_9HYME|nr:Pre-mRNA-splicing factor CWC25 like protein [Habropoda laboriosa]
MKNIEKVWKAEQQQNQEKRKIAELKKEIEMEKDREDMKKYAMEQGVIEKKDDKKLDWMYKGPNQLINREEYLLGRPIDKPFEQMVQAEKDTELNQTPRNHVEHECIPPSLRFFSGNEQVDLARKMQEDPLYAIKKKEMETRNQLLKNPVKLKQLRQLLEQQSKKNKSEKKQKKKKKHKRDVDSDDEAQLDLLLTTKYKQLKDKIRDKDLMKSMKKVKHKRKKKLKRESESSSNESESSNEESLSDKSTKKKHKKKSRSKENNVKIKKYSEEVDNEEERKHEICEESVRVRSSSRESNDASIQERKDRLRKRDIYKSKDKDFRSRSPRDRESSSHKNNYNNRNDIESRHILNKLHRKETMYTKFPSDTFTKSYKEESRNKNKWISQKKQYFTEEEKERRRQEMIANATWRDKERERNVKKYREEEKEEVDNGKVYNQDFVRKQLAAAAEVGTVASRIKANINNIQRSGRAMDTNFAKR